MRLRLKGGAETVADEGREKMGMSRAKETEKNRASIVSAMRSFLHRIHPVSFIAASATHISFVCPLPDSSLVVLVPRPLPTASSTPRAMFL